MTLIDADYFFLGLMAQSYYNLNQTEKARQYADFLATRQNPKDGTLSQVSSFFNPEGNSGVLEATAMATIVWENEFERYSTNIQRAVSYLIKNTYIGSFYYPTLPTILSFRAIIGYLQRIKPIQG
jgi:hypothetical protein